MLIQPFKPKPFSAETNLDRLVPPEGSLDSKIAIVAEAPGQTETRLQRPLIGRSGELFNLLLQQAGIPRSSCYIDNVISERPMHNNVEQFIKFDNKGRGKPTPAYTFYENEFIERIKQVKCNVICAMGNVALYALTGRHGISKWAGSILWSEKVGKKVIPTLHPAAALRQYILRYPIIFDLTKIKEQSEFPEIKDLGITYKTFPSYTDVIVLLEEILEHKLTCSVDIEVVDEEITHIAFSTSPTFGFCIPFRDKGINYFDLQQEANIWSLISRILIDEQITKIFQNGIFDTTFMFDRLGLSTINLEDTMIAQKTVLPDFPMGLDWICRNHTDIPYYKDEGKKYLGKQISSEERFQVYNITDTIVTTQAFPKQLEELQDQKNLETYQAQRDLIGPLSYMGYRGLKVDVEALNKVSLEAEKEIEELTKEFHKECGKEINPMSPTQLKKYFYGEIGLQPYRHQGSISTNEVALKRIARKGYRAAQLVLEIRKLTKLNSTYYKVKLKDGRLVCSYSPVTSMGRASSREDIFGYGTNMQNQPKKMNKFFLADDGMLIGNVDLSQADNRSVAYLAPDEKMIDAFETGKDVHALTASLLFGIPVDEIKQMDKEGIKAPIGYGDQTHRYWGKKCNHSLNFGMGYRKFSLQLEISEQDGKKLWSAYHRAYPDVQQRYHLMVQSELLVNRTLTNCFGRRHLFLDRRGPELFNEAYAFIPQSNTADIINRNGLNAFYYNIFTGEYQEAELMRQVHDSINFQLPLKWGVTKIVKCLLAMKASLEQPLEWKGRKFVIPAEFDLGFSLGTTQDIKFDNNLANQVNQIIMQRGIIK